MNEPITATAPMAITMGDASGVGPEIVLRRAAEGAFADEAVVVYGDLAVLRHGAELLGIDVAIEAIADPEQWRPGVLQVVDAGLARAPPIIVRVRSMPRRAPPLGSTSLPRPTTPSPAGWPAS